MQSDMQSLVIVLQLLCINCMREILHWEWQTDFESLLWSLSVIRMKSASPLPFYSSTKCWLKYITAILLFQAEIMCESQRKIHTSVWLKEKSRCFFMYKFAFFNLVPWRLQHVSYLASAPNTISCTASSNILWHPLPGSEKSLFLPLIPIGKY